MTSQASVERSVKANVDSNAILIGEQVRIKISCVGRSSDTILWPEVTDTLMANIEVVSKSKLDTTYDEYDLNTRVIQQELVVTSFDSGFHAVPPFKFTVNGKNMETEAFVLEVHNMPLDTTARIFDIKNPGVVPFTWIDWLELYWPWPVGVVALILLIWGIYKYIKSKPKKELVFIPQKPKIPAHILALGKLSDLKGKKLWQAGNFKHYYSELTEITREYLENRFGINALDMTTEEIEIRLRNKSIDKKLSEELIKMYQYADLVKFAKVVPVATENEASFNTSEKFIQNTTEREIVEDEKMELSPDLIDSEKSSENLSADGTH